MKFKYILVAVLCLVFGMALAQDPPPLMVMKTTTSRMLSSLRSHKGQLKNRRVIHNIVNRVIMPQIDITSVGRSVVGRRHWVGSSATMHRRFIKAFTGYVIDMYASTLSSYSNEKIRFQPLRSFNSAQSRVRVYSIVQRPGAPAITLNYRLVRRGRSWKIYDFSVDGVSMVQSYRAQFADTLNQGGMPALIAKLSSRRRH